MATYMSENERQIGDPYENLANAIIREAVDEYRKANDNYKRKTIEKFIRSEWFKALTDIDPEFLLERLREECPPLPQPRRGRQK